MSSSSNSRVWRVRTVGMPPGVPVESGDPSTGSCGSNANGLRTSAVVAIESCEFAGEAGKLVAIVTGDWSTV
eukprot:2628561-Amphidinium_carterae.1